MNQSSGQNDTNGFNMNFGKYINAVYVQSLHYLKIAGIALLVSLFSPGIAKADVMEIFARGSISKNYIRVDNFTLNVTGAVGLAFLVIPRVRIEGRFTGISALQSKMDITIGATSGTLYDVKSETAIYSAGVDFDLLGPTAAFQPFFYVGGGYIETSRSYYVMVSGSSASTYIIEPKQLGFSVNLGAGFRVKIGQSLALECEGFAYGVDMTKPNPLINLFGSVGIRLFF